MTASSKKVITGMKVRNLTIAILMNLAILFFLVFAWLSMYLMVIKSLKSITQDQLYPYTFTSVDFSTVVRTTSWHGSP